jgi:hypothetical protein
VKEDLLCLIYELLNHRDISPEKEHVILEKLEIHGCCTDRIAFERRILMRFRAASCKGKGCPDRLKKKIRALLGGI